MLDNSTIENAMDNLPVSISLAGRMFEFREPGRRRGRAILRDIAKVVGQYPDIKTGVFSAESIAVIDDALDIVIDALSITGDMKTRVEDRAEVHEIMAAFNSIVEVVQRPFVGGLQSMASVQAAATSSESGG